MAPRVALIHDFLLDVRGAERVFAALCDLYPQADLFTAVYDERGTEGWFAHRNVNTSFLQRLRPTARTFRPLLPLYPYAMEAMDLSGYDVVVSSSSAWAHGVLVVTPYYNKPNEAGLRAHFAAAAEAAGDTPVVLYNIPSRCVINLSPELLASLAADNSNVVAVKQANNDEMRRLRESITPA